MPAPVIPHAPRSVRLGLGMHSFGEHWRAAKDRHPAASFHDALSFLQYARREGADGVQVALGSPDASLARALRAEQDEHGLYLEAQTPLPFSESELPRFRRDLDFAVTCGARVVRTAALSGRRYETFASLADYEQFKESSWLALQRAEREAKKAGILLAIENHKDWLADELVSWISQLASDHAGVCVDTGNNIALLEDPYEVIDKLAPFATSVHLKDMGVKKSGDGFLLSEVPLGEGTLDLGRVAATLLKANPRLRLNIEMITRNPLSVPCLLPRYWETFPRRPARDLARALGGVERWQSKESLPSVEGLSFEDRLQFEARNVSLCLSKGRTLWRG
ncbi:MAG: sugar phosphate isomerase/epimerase [Verrucomicrobia bacterium]|nr:sugar phosphate isomerase/epimerase [Verrucomicrobiota bacterium]